MEMEITVHELIEAAYITGWNSGAIEQGRKDLLEIQQEGISKRIAAKEKLLTEIDALRTELEAAQRRLQEACFIKEDDKVGFDYSVLDKIYDLKLELKAARAELAALREQTRWIPVTEQRPPENEELYTAKVWYGKTYWIALPPFAPAEGGEG
jgi:hypothetical protein